MPDFNEKLRELNQRLEKMVEYQDYFHREINLIRQEISVLTVTATRLEAENKQAHKEKTPVAEQTKPPIYTPPQTSAETPNASETKQTAPPISETPNFKPPFTDGSQQTKSNIEKIIGENLISLVGIAILILGVGIGAKYAIDRDLISPTMRVVFGYFCGFALLGFAAALKSKYHNFSAVLMSGSLAILYFITFAAYSYYDLINRILAFAAMFAITDAAVVAALRYNRQVIAHVGLVGAYAIPFLLGGDTGNIRALFAYMSIVNAGILWLSVHKYWKPLFYSSFVFTWLTFAGWFLNGYRASEHFQTAFVFAGIFFLIFYAVFLAFKLVNREQFSVENVALVLTNSLTFYGFGCAILESNEPAAQYAGLFTLANAGIHFAIAFAVKKINFIDRAVVHLLAGIGLIFVTIAVPVELDGNWITIFWAAEAALLFWLGRTRAARFYEYLSYPPLILSLLALALDWATLFERQSRFEEAAAVFPFSNRYFLTAVFVAAVFAFLSRVNARTEFETENNGDRQSLVKLTFNVVLAVLVFNIFRTEIANFWYLQTITTALPSTIGDGNLQYDRDLNLFSIVSQINYALLFLAALLFVNNKKLKDYRVAFASFAFSAVILFLFLTFGLEIFSELRESYLSQQDADKFARGWFHLAVRYFSYPFLAAFVLAVYDSLRQDYLHEKFEEKQTETVFDLAVCAVVWWLASSELLNLLHIFGYSQGDRLWLTIFWGVYALAVIVVGIGKNKKYLRFAAIGLSALTLAKLFVYDISHLDTISKTIVFVSLGITLLLISFLYNKYKKLIFEQNEI